MKRQAKAFKFGDVIRVRYRGNRPAVVISCERHNARDLDVVVMLITTKTQHAMRDGAIVLERWEDYGLSEPSIIKPLIASEDIDEAELMGTVDADVKSKIKESMAMIFGLTKKKVSPPSIAK